MITNQLFDKLSCMKKFILISILILLTFSNANAYWARGGFGCGEVIEIDKNNEEIYIESIKDWIEGWLTGYNWVNDTQIGVDISNDSLYHAMVKYCKENPLESMWEGIEDIHYAIQ